VMRNLVILTIMDYCAQFQNPLAVVIPSLYPRMAAAMGRTGKTTSSLHLRDQIILTCISRRDDTLSGVDSPAAQLNFRVSKVMIHFIYGDVDSMLDECRMFRSYLFQKEDNSCFCVLSCFLSPDSVCVKVYCFVQYLCYHAREQPRHSMDTLLLVNSVVFIIAVVRTSCGLRISYATSSYNHRDLPTGSLM
jgi:hypothetical protein